MRLLNEDIIRELNLRLEEEKSLRRKVTLKKLVDLLKELD